MYQGQVQDDWGLVHVEENVRASRMAYAEAGIKDPQKELNLAEVHDCFTIHELVICEDFGGLKCFGHPLGASGLRMIYEGYKQLQGKAGQRQVEIRTRKF